MRPFLCIPLALVITAAAAAAQLAWTRSPGAWRLPTEAGSAYDERRERLVLFGGNQSFQVLDVTWEWDGVLWTRRALTPSPSARTRPAMVWDPDRGAIVLVGGSDANGRFLDDTWAFDGQAWTRVATQGAPTPSSGGAIAYDRARRRIVLHGGFTGATTAHGETWALTGTTWSRLSPAAAPGRRAAHRMVWQPETGEILLHGGFDPVAARTLADTWTFDGRNWTDRSVANGGPGSLCDQLLVWDASRRRATHWGGLRIGAQSQTALGELFDFDGRNWIARSPVGPVPGARTYPHGAYVANADAIVAGAGVANGSDLTDSWSLAPTQPARILAVGPGCAGSNGVPGITHATGQLPWLDSTFDVTVTNLPPSGAVAMNVGLSNTFWPGGPLPFDLTLFGIDGCLLRTSIELSVGVPRQGATARFVGSVCNCPAALGASFYMQAVVADPGVSRPVAVSLSDAVEGVVGGR